MTAHFDGTAVTVRGPVGGGITLAADPATGLARIECWSGPTSAPRPLVSGVVGAADLAALAEHIVSDPGTERTVELGGQTGAAIRLEHTGGSVVRVTAIDGGLVRGLIAIDRSQLALQARMFADALTALDALGAL
jgi:hypothetical protein